MVWVALGAWIATASGLAVSAWRSYRGAERAGSAA